MPVPTTDATGSAGSTPRSSSGDESPREVENRPEEIHASPPLAQGDVAESETDGGNKPKYVRDLCADVSEECMNIVNFDPFQ